MYRKDNYLKRFVDSIVSVIYYEAENDGKMASVEESPEFFSLYQQLVKDNAVFYADLFKAIGEDLELFCIFVSVIYKYTLDGNGIVAVEKLLVEKDVDAYTLEGIMSQIRRLKFVNPNIPNSYSRGREINKKGLEAYLKKYPVKYSYIPYQERNNKLIFVETNSLLCSAHAPSAIVFNVCKYLQEYGYKVYLIVCRPCSNVHKYTKFWGDPCVISYNASIEGQFGIEYEGAHIQGFQYEWVEDKIMLQDAVLELVNREKPLCVFHIGSEGFRHDIYSKITTLISMPCKDGYMVSEAQVLVSYMNSNSRYNKEAQEYATKHNQVIKNISACGTLKNDSGNAFTKEDFDIPENAFAIAFVGNRLKAELSTEFINMLIDLGRKKEEIYFVFIGDEPTGCLTEEFDSRVRYLGYQSELVETMRAMDLFANPVRKGAAGGATCSLQAGVPVVTLRDCDVHANVGEIFACDDLNHMKEQIIRYVEDEGFYKTMVENAKAWCDNRRNINIKEEYYNLMQSVEKDLKEGKI